MENKKWFSDSFRRNLVDMHLADWDKRFMSEFEPEEYYNNLVRANIRSAMIYLHSHVGYSYYPTQIGKMHNGLIGREDAMKRLIDLCRAGGINVVGYYSLIFNTYEEDRHPEWRIIDSDDGTSERQRGSRYGHCCPNNAEYRAYVEEQIKEISEYFTVDGMFYDMTYWHGCCRCPSCKERYLREEGEELPTKVDLNDPKWQKFMHKRYEWIGEFAQYVTKTSKKYMPHASVEHNYAYGVAGGWKQAVTERTNDACDYSGGDLSGDQYLESFVCKYYRAVTKNPPFEYMIYRCSPGLAQHTTTKSKEHLELEVFHAAANHGASLIIDAIDPVGTLNPKVYSLIGDIFGKLIPYEKHLTEGEPIEEVGVYYSTSGRYNTKDEDYDNRLCASNLTRTLVMNNVTMGIISNSHKTIDNAKWKFVFAPAIAGLEESDRQKIYDYVREGGTFYFSGTDERELLRELVGVTFDSYTDTSKTYFAPTEKYSSFFGEEYDEKYPLPVNYRMPYTKLERENVEVVARLTLPYAHPEDPAKFASIHSNPPAEPTDYPQILIADYGKGKVIWSAAPIENDRRVMYMNVVMNILRSFMKEDEQIVTSDAPKQVEICAYKLEDGYQINCVNLTADEERIPVYPFTVSVKLDREPEGVTVCELPDGTLIDHSYSDGKLSFTVKDLVIFKMIEVKMK
jgi:hypothetical protein